MILYTTSILIFIKKLYKKFISSTKLDDKKLWIEVPTIYMSKKNKEKTILNAVNILERNIKIR